MRNIKLIITFSLVLLTFISYSQNAFKIKGKIIDYNTGEPISFANISVCNNSIGLISNEYGEFIFKIPYSLKDQELSINVIGYEKYSQGISFFSEDTIYTIKLEPKIYSIKEVSVKAKRKKKFQNPKKIVKLALENIENNYSFEPFILQGYYREYLKQGSNNYLNMLEGAVIIRDKGFGSSSFPYKAQILQLRYNKDLEIDKEFELAYSNSRRQEDNIKYMPDHDLPSFGGNEFSILLAHDAIRRYKEVTYSYVYQLNEHFVLNHYFNLDSIIYRDNIPIYYISFFYVNNKIYEDKEIIQKSNIQGKIIIRSNNYAIERLEYASYSIENPGVKKYEIISEYKNYNGKMYLNYLAFSNFFKVPVNSRNFQKFNVPLQKQLLQVYDIIVDENSLILKFNKDLNKFSALSKKNYEFSGFIIKKSDSDHSKLDTIYLSKNPDAVSVINSNTIKLFMSNVKYLLEGDMSDDARTEITKLRNNFILRHEGLATIERNVIKMRNVDLTINGIKDLDGHEFNELCTVDMYQFREFFVNEIYESYPSPDYARMIFNDIPLYNQIPVVVEYFWENFNYPISVPLQDNYDSSFKINQ